MKNQLLYTALFDYTKKAIGLLKKEITNTDIPMYPQTVWGYQKGGIYLRKQINQPVWTIPFFKIKDKVKQQEEYKLCRNILKEDDFLSTQIDTMVGTYQFMSRREVDSVINLILFHHLDKKHLQFNTKLFNSVYNEIEKELYNDNIIVERITPLCGFKSSQREIRLSNTISINKLRRDDIINFLNKGVQLGTELIYGLHNVVEFVIKVTIKAPKIIGNDEKVPKPQVEDELLQLTSHVQKIVDALRFFKNGEIHPLGTYTFTKSVFFSGQLMSPFRMPSFIKKNTYVLNKKESDEFKLTWKRLINKNIKNRQFLKIALRRFSQAISRDNEEDKIIDYLICAEALFLNELGNIQGELRYRLAQRAACFLEKNNNKRMIIFKFMKDIYSLRSKIVYGEVVKPPSKEKGDKYSLDKCCNIIEQYLRKALKKAIQLAILPETPKYLVDWDKLVFQK